MPKLAGEVTKEKILDAAEELFSENGFAATSIRAITSRADVNLAALNYHFGSKDSLIDEVFQRRIGPLNRERIRLLDQVESNAVDGEIVLEEVLRAFLAPALRLASDSESGREEVMRLMGRAHTESGDFFRKRIARQFHEVFGRFSGAFQRLLPNLSQEELFWKIHFVVGAMAFTMAHKLALRYLESFRLTGEAIAPEALDTDAEAVLARLVRFAAAGLRAEKDEFLEVG